jgi:transposase-like protein
MMQKRLWRLISQRTIYDETTYTVRVSSKAIKDYLNNQSSRYVQKEKRDIYHIDSKNYTFLILKWS